MPKTIRNEYYKKLTYQNLMQAHLKSRKGKSLRKEIILFNMKQEEYIMWLYEKLKNKTYKHSGYSEFYVTQKFWPEFDKKALEEAVLEFNRRQRRFGV